MTDRTEVHGGGSKIAPLAPLLPGITLEGVAPVRARVPADSTRMVDLRGTRSRILFLGTLISELMPVTADVGHSVHTADPLLAGRVLDAAREPEEARNCR